MACLLETAADVIAVLVPSGTKACIDAADDPGPIVRAGCRSIDKVAIRKHGRWQHPCLEGAIFVVAELGGTDRRRTGHEYQLIGRRELHHLDRRQKGAGGLLAADHNMRKQWREHVASQDATPPLFRCGSTRNGNLPRCSSANWHTLDAELDVFDE